MHFSAVPHAFLHLFSAALCMHRFECITRPMDGDQPAGEYDQLQAHVGRRKPTQSGRNAEITLGPMSSYGACL